MKHLQDIITESILDDNIEDENIIPMIFKSIMNAKSFKEFKDITLSLKSYLDDEIGDDYKKALDKANKNRSGQYLAIDSDLGRSFYKIVVAAGPSRIYYVKYHDITNRVSVLGLNVSFSDFCSDTESVYILNDKWNELRKMIINKK